MWAAELEEERSQDVPDSGRFSHVPVLKRELVDSLFSAQGGLYVDATFGGGGHTEALLEANPGARVIAIDRDRDVLESSAERLSRFGDRLRVLHGRFGDLQKLLEQAGVEQVDGIMADLGLSSVQLDDAERGMSFRREGPLDMRMDRTCGRTALELLEECDQEELADVIYRFGEERRSRRVARCIKQALAEGKLRTTLDLRRAVVRAVGPARVGGVDPATRTFQGLRIAVNGELEELGQLLETAPQVLVPQGVLAVISFHSLEDRMVKRAFQNRALWQPLNKKPLCAGDAETKINPRSRSAKLRAARLREAELLEEES